MVIDFEAVKKELVENTKDYITAEVNYSRLTPDGV